MIGIVSYAFLFRLAGANYESCQPTNIQTECKGLGLSIHPHPWVVTLDVFFIDGLLLFFTLTIKSMHVIIGLAIVCVSNLLCLSHIIPRFAHRMAMNNEHVSLTVES